MDLSWAALILKCFNIPNPFFYSCYYTWDHINSYTILHYSKQCQNYAILYCTVLYPTVWYYDACVIIFTYTAIKTIIRCHILEFGSDTTTFSFQFKSNARAMLNHPLRSTFFLRGRKSALTSFYLHYSEILLYLWLYPTFGFFSQL